MEFVQKFLEKLKKPLFLAILGLLSLFEKKKKKKRIFLKNWALLVFRFYNIYHHVKNLKKLTRKYQGKLIADTGTDRWTDGQISIISQFNGDRIICLWESNNLQVCITK